MEPTKKSARIAGLLYLIMGITGAFGLMYVPSAIIVAGDAAATVNNIIASEVLFRLGIVSQLICQTIFVFLALALYRLFKDVHKNLTVLMVALVLAAVPIAFLNEINRAAALVLLSGADYLKEFQPEQLHAQVMFFLNLYNQGIFIVEVFWGLWLLPFGLLVYKSGFIPKVLGIFLMIGCISYLVDSLTALLFPQYKEAITPYLMLPLSVGEISMILWLLIVGVKVQKPMVSETD